jgi:hypothetical protein
MHLGESDSWFWLFHPITGWPDHPILHWLQLQELPKSACYNKVIVQSP